MVGLKLLNRLLIRIIWKFVRPKAVLTLKPGEVRKLNDELIVEKTPDGRIIIYEVE